MEIRFNFKKIKSSQALIAHMEGRMAKLMHFENRPLQIHVSFEKIKGDCIVEARVHEGRRDFKASATTGDFYHSVDACVERLVRQLAKKKRVVRQHHKPLNAKSGKFRVIEPDMGYDFKKLRKKSA